MKKRLLMQVLVLMCALGAFAANAGDYIFSRTAKYKVLTGENLFNAGQFAAGYDAVWSNGYGGTLSAVWSVETAQGPNGENVIKSTGASTNEGDTLACVQQLPAGSYTFSFYVKSESAITAEVIATRTNYVNFGTNSVGDFSIETAVAKQTSYGTEWSQVVYTVEAASDCYFVFMAGNVASNTMFTNFEIYKVEEVYDTRIADRLVAYMEGLVAEESMTEGKADLQEYIDGIKGILADQTSSEDFATMEGALSESDLVIGAYLDVNAGNVVGTTVDGVRTERYLYDWQRWSYANFNNVSTRNNWEFTGGRWGFSPNCIEGVSTDSNGNLLTSAYLERPWEDGYVASAGIQTNYQLNCGLRTLPETLAGTSLGAGKYMFTIEAQAVAAAEKAAPYGANDGIEIAGPWMWIGSDTLCFRPQTATDMAEHPTWRFADTKTVLNNTDWQKLYIIGDIKEGEDIGAGFHFPVIAGNTGGRYSLRNPEFRVIGKSQEVVDHLYAYDQLAVQQGALKVRLDSANVQNAKTLADGYPWGHAILQDSIAKFTETYNTLLTVVDANGQELQPEKVTLAYKDEILAAVNAMNSAISNYYKMNKYYQTLVADIAICNESLNDAANASGDKATFKAVIDKAQAMVDGTSVDANQDEAFNTQDDELLTAKEVFEQGTASRSNPADLTHSVVNGDFTSGFSTSSNVTPSGVTVSNGWNWEVGTDAQRWEIRETNNVSSGYKASVWRGTTVGPNAKARQVVTLNKAGVYEYRAKAYAMDDTWSQYCAIAKFASIIDFDTFDMVPQDTLYLPNVRLFFGPDGAVNDSITLTKCAPVYGEFYSRYTPLVYSIIYVKQNDTPEDVELGFQALDNSASAGANGFGFADNHVYYLGSEAAYKTALQADYNAEVTKAKALIAQYGDKAQWVANKFYKYFGETIEGADYDPNAALWVTPAASMTIQQMQNAYLSIVELEEMLTYVATYTPEQTGIVETAKDQIAPVVAGVYTLAGQKVGNSLEDLKGLGKGIYIINGKKYLVK